MVGGVITPSQFWQARIAEILIAVTARDDQQFGRCSCARLGKQININSVFCFKSAISATLRSHKTTIPYFLPMQTTTLNHEDKNFPAQVYGNFPTEFFENCHSINVCNLWGHCIAIKLWNRIYRQWETVVTWWCGWSLPLKEYLGWPLRREGRGSGVSSTLVKNLFKVLH